MREVKDGAYVGYATLKYPGLFHKYEILDKSLDLITHHDIVIFYKAYETNIEELEDFIDQFEAKRETKHTKLREIVDLAKTKKSSEELIEPIEPRTLFNYVQKGDAKGFIEYCEALKAKYEFMYDENGMTTLNVGGLSSALPIVDVKDEV